MRKILTFALFLLCTGLPSSATIALVQHTNKDAGTVTSTTLAYGSNNSSNNLLVVISRTGGTTATITITDSCGNTWTNLTRFSVSGVGVTQAAWAVSACSSANTITDTLSTSTTLRMAIYEFSGTATVSPVDFDSNAGTSTGSAVSSASHTPAANNELIVSFAAFSAGVNGVTAGSSGGTYTVQDQVPAAPNTKLGVETLIQTTATATTGDMTITSDQWTAGMVFFKPAGGAATPIRHRAVQN